MFKLYRKSQEAQLNWIRNHPVQYIALNAITIAALFGYWEYREPPRDARDQERDRPAGEVISRRGTNHGFSFSLQFAYISWLIMTIHPYQTRS